MTTTTVHTRAAILSIGDELTLGQTLDTNSQWLSQRMVLKGIVPVEHVTVPDDRAQIAGAIVRMAALCDVLLISGGLGPTADDLTRDALCDATSDTLTLDEAALADLETWFRGRGRPLAAINRVQAMRPSRGTCLKNPHGTAPGLATTLALSGGHAVDIFCVPGPPNELKPMVLELIEPQLRPPPGRTVRTRVLPCFGIGESDLAQRLGAMMARDRVPLVGTTASKGVVSCRIRYEGPLAPPEADKLLDADERAIRGLAGEYVFAVGERSLAHAVLELLAQQKRTLAVAESCTGGMLGAMITDVPGSSAAFSGGFLAYSNALKTALLGVDAALIAAHGAVSEPVARAMAVGARNRAQADYALSITGIAGPGGGSADKPVGTVYIGLAGPNETDDVRRFSFRGDRATIRERAAQCALGLLRLHLAGHARAKLLWQTP